MPKFVKESEIGGELELDYNYEHPVKKERFGNGARDANNMETESEWIKSQVQTSDEKIEKYKTRIETENGRMKSSRERLAKLLQLARHVGVSEYEGKTAEQKACEEIMARLERLRKDSEGTRRRMNVHDTDQRKVIIGLEEQINAVRQAISDKDQYKGFFLIRIDY